MAPTLEQVFVLRTYHTKDDTLSFGSTNGRAPRFIAPLTGGSLRGSGVDAEFVQGGSDWRTLDTTTMTGHLDARMHFRSRARTDVFYVHFTGLVRFDEKIGLIMEWSSDVQSTTSADHYSFISPQFETSSAEQKWMERTAFVGHGHYVVEQDDDGSQKQAVEYEIYRLVTG
nr:hypothetical protein CFP56_02723 [Quercus suber]